MLLQTKTRETVDCVVSHHNKGYQTTWAKTPGKKKKNRAKSVAKVAFSATENMKTGSSR